MKKIIIVTLFFIMGVSATSFAETFTLPEVIQYAKENQPIFHSLVQKIDQLKFQEKEIESFYDTHLNLETGFSTLKQQALSPFEPESVSGVTGKFSIQKNFSNGLNAELYTQIEQSSSTYSPAAASFGLPSDSAESKTGINLYLPLSQNGFGALDQLRILIQKLQVKQQRLNIEQTLRDRTYLVYQSYLAHQLAQTVVSSRKNTLKRNQEYLTIANRKKATGFIENSELIQAQLAVLTSEKDLIGSEQQQKESLTQFKTNIGYPLDQELLIDLDQKLPAFEMDFETFQNKVLANDLNAQGLSVNVLVSLKGISSAQNALNAKWDLTGSFYITGRNTDTPTSYADSFSFQYPGAFIGLTTDLAGGSESEKAQWEQKQIQEKIAQSDYQAYLKSLQGNIRQAYDQYHYYLEAYQLNQKLIDKHQTYLKQLKRDYALGKVDRFQVTQAEINYQLAENGFFQSKINLDLSYVQLQYLMGEL